MTSFHQLVQDLIVGTVTRHTFTPYEMELLLDLTACRMRKSARTDLLRRYLKAVQQASAESVPPMRLSFFIESAGRKRALSRTGNSGGEENIASGLSSE